MPIIISDYTELDTVTQTYDNLQKPRILTAPATITELATVEGHRFYCEFDAVFNAGETKYILYQMPSTLDGTIVGLQNRQFKSRDGGAELEILWDSTGVSAGVLLPIFNENRNSNTTSHVDVSVCTLTGDGTIRERDFLTGIGVGSNSSGDISPALGFRLYSPDSFFIAKITNLTTPTTNRIRIAYSWIEVSSDEVT